jgi:hypothetical protein
MKRRAYDKNNKQFKNYGGRGVVVCEAWKNDFKSFYDWAISNGWRKGLELDKDKLAPQQLGDIYSPEFCSFLTPQENSWNTSKNRLIEYKGTIKCLAEWAKELGINYKALHARLAVGWSVDKAFTAKKFSR